MEQDAFELQQGDVVGVPIESPFDPVMGFLPIAGLHGQQPLENVSVQVPRVLLEGVGQGHVHPGHLLGLEGARHPKSSVVGSPAGPPVRRRGLEPVPENGLGLGAVVFLQVQVAPVHEHPEGRLGAPCRFQVDLVGPLPLLQLPGRVGGLRDLPRGSKSAQIVEIEQASGEAPHTLFVSAALRELQPEPQDVGVPVSGGREPLQRGRVRSRRHQLQDLVQRGGRLLPETGRRQQS